MNEEERELMNNLASEVKTLKNIVKGHGIDIEKFCKMARQIDMIKLSAISKGQVYEPNVR